MGKDTEISGSVEDRSGPPPWAVDEDVPDGEFFDEAFEAWQQYGKHEALWALHDRITAPYRDRAASAVRGLLDATEKAGRDGYDQGYREGRDTASRDAGAAIDAAREAGREEVAALVRRWVRWQAESDCSPREALERLAAEVGPAPSPKSTGPAAVKPLSHRYYPCEAECTLRGRWVDTDGLAWCDDHKPAGDVAGVDPEATEVSPMGGTPEPEAAARQAALVRLAQEAEYFEAHVRGCAQMLGECDSDACPLCSTEWQDLQTAIEGAAKIGAIPQDGAEPPAAPTEPGPGEMKPCPFCAVAAQAVEEPPGFGAWVTCGCGAEGPAASDREAAIAKWNAAPRATPAAALQGAGPATSDADPPGWRVQYEADGSAHWWCSVEGDAEPAFDEQALARAQQACWAMAIESARAVLAAAAPQGAGPGQRAKAAAFLRDHATTDALVADIASDIYQPDYPREMLMQDVERLRDELADVQRRWLSTLRANEDLLATAESAAPSAHQSETPDTTKEKHDANHERREEADSPRSKGGRRLLPTDAGQVERQRGQAIAGGRARPDAGHRDERCGDVVGREGRLTAAAPLGAGPEDRSAPPPGWRWEVGANDFRTGYCVRPNEGVRTLEDAWALHDQIMRAAPSAPQAEALGIDPSNGAYGDPVVMECAGEPGCGQHEHAIAFLCTRCETHRYPTLAPRGQKATPPQAETPDRYGAGLEEGRAEVLALLTDAALLDLMDEETVATGEGCSEDVGEEAERRGLIRWHGEDVQGEERGTLTAKGKTARPTPGAPQGGPLLTREEAGRVQALLLDRACDHAREAWNLDAITQRLSLYHLTGCIEPATPPHGEPPGDVAPGEQVEERERGQVSEEVE